MNQPNQDEELKEIYNNVSGTYHSARMRKEDFISSIKQWAEDECKKCNDLRNNPDFGGECKHDGDKMGGSDCSTLCIKCGKNLL